MAADMRLGAPALKALDATAAMMDERAFHALYAQTAGQLRAYAARVLGDLTQADDIVQESYLRLLRTPPATDDVQQLRAFLFRVASNLMVDHWRQQRRHRELPEELAAGASTPAPDVPRRLDMTRTFGLLKPQQRQLLWMAYVEETGHRDIAAALGLRERSIRVLLHRARRKLARLLQQNDQGVR